MSNWICTLHEEGLCDGEQHGKQHSPTPWKVLLPLRAPDSDGKLDIGIAADVGGRVKIIAECFGRVGHADYVDAQANADFLVRAANAHEELLSALVIALRDHKVNDPHHSDLCDLCQMMTQAIAKGEGK